MGEKTFELEKRRKQPSSNCKANKPNMAKNQTNNLQSHSNLDTSSFWIVEINQCFSRSFHRAKGKLGNAFDMVARLVLDAIGDTHPGVANRFLMRAGNEKKKRLRDQESIEE